MNYLDLMNNFSVSDLQKILGKEIIENLNEWNYEQENKWRMNMETASDAFLNIVDFIYYKLSEK